MQIARTALLLAPFWIAAATPAGAAQELSPTKAQHEQLDTQTYLARIARAQLLFEVEGQFEAADRALMQLQKGATHQAETAPDSFDATAVLLEFLLARVNLLLERRPEAALAGLVETLDVASAEHASLKSRAWRTALARVAEVDPRVIALMRRLESQAGKDVAQTVDELVNQFVEDNQTHQILQLGTRAVPALKARILADLDRFSASVANDELAVLIRIDEVAAGEFVLAHLGEGGTLWRGRIVRAMNLSNGNPDFGVLGQHQSDAWEYSSGFPCNCRRQHWVEVLERLTTMPDVSADALRMVQPLVLHGAITPKLVAALVAALRSGQPEQVQAALYALDSPYWTPGVERALDIAVAHESAHVRIFAANQLARYTESAALRARVTDPEAGVRRALARTLTARAESYPLYIENFRVYGNDKDFFPTLGEESRAILTRFATDPDVQVRTRVIEALPLLTTPLEPETYMQLCKDPDVEIRESLALVALSLPPELRARVLLALTADENARVLLGVDMALASDEWDRPELLLPVLRARQVHPAQSIASRQWNTVLNKAVASDAGLNQLVDWAIEDRDKGSLIELLGDNIARIDAARMARSLPFICEVDGYAGVKIIELIRRNAPESDHLRPALRELARDARLPPVLRFLAVSSTAAEGGPVVVEVMSEALRDPSAWAGERRKGRRSAYSKVDDLLELVPPGDRNRIILTVVSDDGADGELAAIVAREFAWEAPLADAIVGQILDRWFSASPSYAMYALRSAIQRMGSYPASANLEVLVEALGRGGLRSQALESIGKLHDPTLLPALEKLLANPGDSDWLRAVEAVTNYMSDDAAEVLLNVATGAGSLEARSACLAGLAAIRDFQDARSHFATRRVSRQTRDGAITDLVGMLEDEHAEVRIQAIRALATFESVESIPRLIRMLPDADEVTAKALRETLDRLNGIAPEEEQ